MKIVFLSDDFPPKSYGGAGIVAFNQARELASRGHEVFVITTTQDNNDVGQVVLDGLTIHKIYAHYHERWRAYRSLYNTQTIFGVKKLLEELQPDVVHAHNVHFYLSYYVLILARRYSKRVVLTMHDVMSVYYGKLFPRITIMQDGSQPVDYKISPWQQFCEYRMRYNPFRNLIIKNYLKIISYIFCYYIFV